jgi:Spy/CpxP family protein refolding chaperone
MQQRAIKALSEQQVADLKAGRGMALALPAELNGYPGPLHTLELADALRLTPQQKSQTQKLFDEMKQQSVAAGAELISAEESLDLLLKKKTATLANMGAAIKRAAEAQAKLRETHLKYHLSMLEVLSAEQVAIYNKVRGY